MAKQNKPPVISPQVVIKAYTEAKKAYAEVTKATTKMPVIKK